LMRKLKIGKLVEKQTINLKQKSQEISSSSDEQRKAVTEIIKSISYINEISQTNSQNTEDMSLDTDKLLNLIEELKKSIEEYNKREGVIVPVN
jgi:methyl-accepting chemotaxis protein